LGSDPMRGLTPI